MQALICTRFYFIGLRNKKFYKYYFDKERKEETMERFFPLWPLKQSPKFMQYTSKESKWTRKCKEHYDYIKQYLDILLEAQEKKELKAHTKRLMVDTSKRCIGCLECVRACSTAFFKVPDPEKACLKIVEKSDWKPVTCIQCGKCATVCPEGAISKNGLGVWTIDRKKCTGCGKCRTVCPMDVMVEASPTLTGKCISCGLCAKACPMDVLYIAEGPKA